MATDPEQIEVTSEAFDDGDVLPTRFAHDKDDVSPPLGWSSVPPHASELAVTCEDPDAPGGTFTHWIVSGIDPSTTGVAEGTVPAGSTVGVNGFGELGWGGPEPPLGDDAHRYVFTVFAAAAPLLLTADADPDELRSALEGVELARGEIVGLYRRPAP